MLHAVILAGGSGTRFWPLSRRDRPKQFLNLTGSRTLLQQSFDRLRELTEPERIYVVTSATLAAGVAEQLPEMPGENLLVEPRGKDTAIAMGLAAALIAPRDPEAVLAMTPADHVIRPAAALKAAIEQAAELARTRGAIVTFGITPRSPHTGYGYIHQGEALQGAGALPSFSVGAFCEKPDLATAETYLAGGEHYWNSGIFVWTAHTLLSALAEHLPRTHQALERIAAAWGGETRDAVLAQEYAAVEKISIDYAVLEKASGVTVVVPQVEWSDVGSWAAIPELYAQDEAGNTIRETPFVGLDATNCLVQGDGRLVAVIGMDDVVVVQTRDATLVCPRSRAEEVKQLVKRLEEQGLEAYT